ncbi:MAG: hypothetical protein DMF58_16325 [Acidobacteria bacterium]|nr:MAG: hypothetical protein DMF58_16325 [Acidobacteriota bacterium]
MFAMKPALAALLLIAYATILVRHVSRAAGGADSSGYLNEARLIAAGKQSLPIELLTTLHLGADWAYIFTPLGFTSSGRVMIPAYPPGLPAHFAIAAAVGGWAWAPFLVPPIAALACLALMFVLARQFGLGDSAAFGGAAILAACPVFIFMAAQPMSDVVATAWTLAAIVAALAASRHDVIPTLSASEGEGPVWAGGTKSYVRTAQPHRFLPFAPLRVGMTALAGAAFAISVCVRPSNVLMVIPLAFALRFRIRLLLIAAAAALPFGIVMMIWNHALFGNAMTTGYGSVSEMVKWSYVRERLPHYSFWLAAQLTPLVFPLGLFTRRALLWAWFVPLFVFYCFYGAYETWWYTRFLLPVIPALIIGFLLIASRFPRAVVAALIVAIVGFAVWQDRRLGPLNVGADEPMYPETIHWAERQLPRDAIVLNQQFSGSFLYYSGRDTVRFDELDNDRFQLLRAYAGAANLRWYALLTPEELEQVRGRFAANWTPLSQHRGMWLMRLD